MNRLNKELTDELKAYQDRTTLLLEMQNIDWEKLPKDTLLKTSNDLNELLKGQGVVLHFAAYIKEKEIIQCVADGRTTKTRLPQSCNYGYMERKYALLA